MGHRGRQGPSLEIHEGLHWTLSLSYKGRAGAFYRYMQATSRYNGRAEMFLWGISERQGLSLHLCEGHEKDLHEENGHSQDLCKGFAKDRTFVKGRELALTFPKVLERT